MSGDFPREMVRDEPRRAHHGHVLPGRDEEVPRGNMVQTMVAHLSEESFTVGRFVFAEVKSTSDEATEGA